MRFAVVMLVLACAGAGPATRPDELAALRAEVAALRKENAALKRQLAQFHATTQPSDKIRAAIDDQRLEVGMTLEQANEAMQSAGRLVSKDDMGEYYEWPSPRQRFFVPSPGRVQRARGDAVRGDFRNGKLVSFSSDD
jgi:hypothetical protein